MRWLGFGHFICRARVGGFSFFELSARKLGEFVSEGVFGELGEGESKEKTKIEGSLSTVQRATLSLPKK